MTIQPTTIEREKELGRNLRDLRLRKNITQQELAERGNVALNAVKRLEAGKGATVTSLIKVLRALGREEWLESLAPTVTISPLQLLKNRKPLRQRASPSKGGARV